MENPIIPFRINQQGISAYSAFDALAQVNPEIAAVAYAHRDGILKPEIMPYIARFRELQTTEKLGVLDFITENTRIESRERRNQDDNQTILGVTRMNEEGETERTRITDKGQTIRTALQERGATERTSLECQAAVSINRMKYEANVQIVREHMAGQRYLSDNQLKATYIEAQALQNAMKIQSITKMSMSKDRMREVIKKAEFEYLAKVQEAEALRAIEDERISGEVASNYLAIQAHMYQLYLQNELGMITAKKETDKEAYKTVTKITKEALRTLASRDLDEIIIEAETSAGLVKCSIKAKNGQK